MLPLFHFPRSTKIDFKKHLNVQRQDVGVIDQVTASRKKFLELSSKNDNAYAIGGLISAIDLYLPHITALANWVDSHKTTSVETDKKGNKKYDTNIFKENIEFEWRSCFSDKSTQYCVVNDFQFELGMTLAAKAGLLWEKARVLLSNLAVALRSGGSSTHLADCSAAAMNLREAAGIWKYIGSTIIPKTIIANSTSKATPPPEMSPIFCQSMETLCLGSGQLLAYVGSSAKVLPAGPVGPDGKPGPVNEDAPRVAHSPPSLCASIIMDYCEKLKTAAFSLDGQKEVRKNLPPCFGDPGKNNGFIHYFAIPISLCLAHLSMAHSMWDQKRYGEAVAHVRAAQAEMNKIESKQPKMSDDASVLYAYAREDLEKKSREFQRDNSFLYRQPVPPEVSAPDPRSLCKAVEFTPVQPAWSDLPSKM